VPRPGEPLADPKDINTMPLAMKIPICSMKFD